MFFFFDQSNPTLSSMAFETYVINVMRDYLLEQGKTLYSTSNRDMFDATLPDGIDDIPGPVYLEIKSAFSNKSGYFRSVERFALQAREAEIGALLIILGTEFTEEGKNSIVRLAQSRAKRKVYVWDIGDFNEKTQRFQSKYMDFQESPAKAIVDDVINNQFTSEDAEKAKKYLLSTLKKKYQNEELTLFLGAGVSIDAGIPLWKDLINSLLSEMILRRTKDKQDELLAEHLNEIINLAYRNQEDSPITQMRYIRGAFDTAEYNQLVHSVLYNKVPRTNTKLLNALAKICTPRRNHIGVQGVVTYNFDDLLERKLKQQKVATNTISTEQDTTILDKLSIFHVHGYMPQRYDKSDEHAELIFSEEDYHKIYRDAYCWSNIVQLNYLRESTCLFIGCSLTDPNLRRLLDVATRNNEKPRHYAFLRRNNLSHSENVNPEALNFYKSIDLSLREKYYATMGLNIIWIDEFEEIPHILNSLIE